MAFELSYAALWVLVLLQTVVLVGLAHSFFRLKSSGAFSDERMRGRKARRFTATDLTGASISTASMDGDPYAVLFVSPSCASCNVTLDELGAVSSKADGNVIVVCRGDVADCRRLAESYGLAVPVIADPSFEISGLFEVNSVPTAVTVDAKGTITRYGHPQRDEEVVDIRDVDEALESRDEVRV